MFKQAICLKREQKEEYRALYIILAIAIPALLTLLCLVALKIEPFGDKSLVVSDANGYYMPYLSYCKSIFQGNHDLLYSFSQDIGGGISATIWPYLFNPFSWIVSLFQYEAYPAAYSWGILLITALYGLSMYLLLADIHGHKVENLLFSTCYAMSGFAVCFNINTAFFFGGPVCLPVMLLGLRKIFRRESPLIYILALTYPIILQIQMGFAICIAAFLFFLAKLYVEDHEGEMKHLWGRFIGSSLAGGLLGSIIWLPGLKIISQGRGNLNLEDFIFTSNAPLLQFVSRLFSGANSVAQVTAGFPAMFCGILPVALVILFFTNKNISRKRKIAYAVLLMVYILAFYIRTFTSIFQGFTHANWFNYRFSFVFIFLLLLIASEQLERLEEVTERDAKVCGICVLIITLIVFFLPYEFIDGGKVVLDLTLLGIMGAAFLFHLKAPDKAPTRVLILMFCLCTFFQLYLNYYFCTQSVLKEWKDSGTQYEESLLKKATLTEAVKNSDNDFYRIESELKLPGSNGNDGLFLDYNGVGFAGHTERYFVSQGLSRLGIDFYSGCWNSYSEGVPAATDDLLGIKYMLSERDLTEEKGYDKKINVEGLNLFENPNALQIAMLSEEAITEVSIAEGKNVFENLNAIWSGLTGDQRRIFTEETNITYSNHNPTDTCDLTYDDVMNLVQEDSFSPTEEGVSTIYEENSSKEVLQRGIAADDNRYKAYIEFRFIAKQTGPIYLYDYASYMEGYGTIEDVIQYVGYYHEDDEVIGKLYLNYNITEQVLLDTVKCLHIAYSDEELLKEYTKLINSRNCTIVKESDSHLSGDAKIADGQRLLFTIPYDEGWTLVVDGVEARLDKTADLFMSADIGAGLHHYEMTFKPSGLNAGIGFTVAAVFMTIVLCLMGGRRKKQVTVINGEQKNKEPLEEDVLTDKPEERNEETTSDLVPHSNENSVEGEAQSEE